MTADKATNRIEAGQILTHPGAEPSIGSGWIEAENGRITAVKPSEAIAANRRVLIALPALVNAHDHGRGNPTLAYGAMDDALELWSASLRLEPRIDPYLVAAVAFARMALSGIAVANHCHNSFNANQLVEEAEGVAKAANDVGIRIAFSCPITDRNPFAYGGPEAVAPYHNPDDWAEIVQWMPDYKSAEEQLARVDAIDAAYGSDSFRPQYGPIGPQWCQDDTLAAIADASARTGRRIHMHLLETKIQRDWSDSVYDGGIVKFLDSIGFLSPRLTVAHGVWLSEEDCELMADRGVTVSVNTASNFRLRSGIAPVERFRSAGTKFAIGLDGTSVDDDADGLRDMRLFNWLHQGFGVDDGLDRAGLFHAASCRGYETFDNALGDGYLAAGNRADVLVLDQAAMTADWLVEPDDLVELLLARMTKAHVRELYVGRRKIVADGQILTVDLPELEKAVRDQSLAFVRTQDFEKRRALVNRHRAALRDYYKSRSYRGKGRY